MYKGYYELPDTTRIKESTSGTRVRTIEEEDQDRMEFVIKALEEHERKGKARAQEQETTARIVEVDEQDFLQRM